jgi:2',3'-cyclic-nucleotide 2'-phosphodiesterase (5'-nucleotidase family)
MLGLTYFGILVLVAAALAPQSLSGRVEMSGAACRPGLSTSLRIVATTDVHGHIRGWDYYSNNPDSVRGLSRAATIVDSVRSANQGRVILVDAGDFLQGTPLAFVAARSAKAAPNPIIAAMNVMRYDAAVIGNHEFNYGVPYLDGARAEARFPMLAANVTSDGARPRYASFTLVKRAGVTVGIVGATTPGSNLWDASNLSRAGLRVGDILPSVRTAVAQARAAGAEAIVVVLHSGLDEPSSYDTVSTGVASENVAARVATGITGIDVVVYGHSHRENRGQKIGGTLLIQPKNWATSVAVVTLPLTCSVNHRWIAAGATGSLIQSVNHAEDPAVMRAVSRAHVATVAYVKSPIGTTPDTWTATTAREGPTPIMNFILDVERRAANADIASASAFDLDAHLGPGPITVAQIAQLYPYDNTLRAVRISGAQLRDYLEFSSRYYKTDASGQTVIDTTVAGYNFDVVSGVDYELVPGLSVGQRVTSLKYRGRPVAPTDSFTLALNNYRQTGGGGYAMLRGAPVVYDRQQEIRQLLIDEVRRRRVLHKSDFDASNWSISDFTAKAANQPRTIPK